MINFIARHHRRRPAVINGCACLFLLMAHSQADAGDDPEAEDTDGAAAGHTEVQPAGAHGDNIIDRIFSPLDKAVTDINRDINAGNDDPAGESSD